MPSRPEEPVILVLAGVNGAGKSSIGGEALRDMNADYFNPDEAALEIQNATGCTAEEANAKAWDEGRRHLEAAIRDRTAYAFETTLGGHTIPRLLMDASRAGIHVRIWFVGLRSPEQHIARVRARVAAGGHDIPEAKIRERWETSRRNIAELLPYIDELSLFDNSAERDPATDEIPSPQRVLRWKNGRIIAEIENVPAWAQPIVDAARMLQAPRF